jgi:hypothetical protein
MESARLARLLGASLSPAARPPAATAGPALLPAPHPQARAKLLGWYDRVHRVLPWRRNPHSKLPGGGAPPASGGAAAAEPAPEGLSPQDFAYRVWVSEIMLQQVGRRAGRWGWGWAGAWGRGRAELWGGGL